MRTAMSLSPSVYFTTVLVLSLGSGLSSSIIYKYLRQYTTILVLMQLYFVLGQEQNKVALVTRIVVY